MNLPFKMNGVRESGVKKDEDKERSITRYERKLADYRDTLETYKNYINEYSNRLDNYDKKSFNNQLSVIQTALDITYMKEQGEKISDLLEELKSGTLNQMNFTVDRLADVIADTQDKLEGVDENITNHFNGLLSKLQAETRLQNKIIQDEFAVTVNRLNHKIKKSNTLIWFLFIFHIISIAGLVFVILYILDIIPVY